jgi:hypothetical protein
LLADDLSKSCIPEETQTDMIGNEEEEQTEKHDDASIAAGQVRDNKELLLKFLDRLIPMILFVGMGALTILFVMLTFMMLIGCIEIAVLAFLAFALYNFSDGAGNEEVAADVRVNQNTIMD